MMEDRKWAASGRRKVMAGHMAGHGRSCEVMGGHGRSWEVIAGQGI